MRRLHIFTLLLVAFGPYPARGDEIETIVEFQCLPKQNELHLLEYVQGGKYASIFERHYSGLGFRIHFPDKEKMEKSEHHKCKIGSASLTIEIPKEEAGFFLWLENKQLVYRWPTSNYPWPAQPPGWENLEEEKRIFVVKALRKDENAKKYCQYPNNAAADILEEWKDMRICGRWFKVQDYWSAPN